MSTNDNGYEDQDFDANEQYDDQYDEQNEDEMLEDEMEEEEGPGEESFIAAMAGSMPWVISILVHVGIFLILLSIILFEAAKPKKKINIPGTTTSISPKPGGSFSNSARSAVTPSSRAQTSPQPSPTSSSSTDISDTTSNAIAVGGGGGTPGGGDKGLAQPGGGGGPRGSFFGAGGNANNIVFLIDKSGSMVDIFTEVQEAMQKSIQNMDIPQKFQVIMFADGEPEMPKFGKGVGMAEANLRNKKLALEFIKNTEVEAETDPVQALEMAFKILRKGKAAGKLEGGTLIFLLTDGQFTDREQVLKLVKELTSKYDDIAINTYLYNENEEDEEIKMAKKDLKEIAFMSGSGACRGAFVDIANDKKYESGKAASTVTAGQAKENIDLGEAEEIID